MSTIKRALGLPTPPEVASAVVQETHKVLHELELSQQKVQSALGDDTTGFFLGDAYLTKRKHKRTTPKPRTGGTADGHE